MLTESVKKDIQELTTILRKLDDAGRVIMLSNAMVLLARQEVTKSKEKNGYCENGIEGDEEWKK